MLLEKKVILKVKELKKVKVYLIQNDIIKIEPVEHCELKVSDIIQIQQCKKEFIGERRHCILFVTPQMGTLSKEAREMSSSEPVNKNAIAKAIVLRNVGMRIITQFFIKVNKPSVEHKMFHNEQEALAWLRKKMKLEMT